MYIINCFHSPIMYSASPYSLRFAENINNEHYNIIKLMKEFWLGNDFSVKFYQYKNQFDHRW